jgi:hypothetical protein
VIECIAAAHTWFWALTGLLLLSEALGQTKLVKANGVLSFILDMLVGIIRLIRTILFRR